MNPPTGINLFDLLAEQKGHPEMPKNLEELHILEMSAKDQGYMDLHEYIRSWRLYLEYQVKAEWNASES